MRLVLFDIDGTLIDSGGAGTLSLDLAFKEVFLIENAFKGIQMAGKTDTEIIKEGLRKYDISIDGNIEKVINNYLKNLKIAINNEKRHVKEGVYEILEKLSLKRDIGLGLLTGNLENGARIKLAPFNLNRYFITGAFGSDNEDRNKLLPIAVRKFEELYRTKIDITKCVVIGDTPRDVDCAKIYNAKCIGVATGLYPIDTLKNAGADIVVRNLLCCDSLLQFI